MGYTTVGNIRLLTGLTVDDISDADLISILDFATYQINSEIQVLVVREPVEWIDNTRQNKVDGSNATFYVRNWENYFLGDTNGSGTVTTADLTVYLVASDGTETEATFSSVTANSGKFVLSSAPASDKNVYVTYTYAPVSVSDPHPLVKMAATYLAGALAYLKVDPRKMQSYAIGKLRVSKQSQAYQVYFDKFKQITHEIRSRPLKKVEGPSYRDVILPGFSGGGAIPGTGTSQGTW